MKVLLLKNKTSQLDKYDQVFRSNGFEPQFIPLLTHTHITGQFFDLAQRPEYLNDLKYIIITSQRTVECLNESVLPFLSDEARAKVLSKPVYTVGPATEDFLKRIGFTDLRGGEDAGNGSSLADIILADQLQFKNQPHTANDICHPPLFLVGEIRRDIIPKKLSAKGIKIDEVVMYETKCMPDNVERFQNAIEDDIWVVFFSPQGTEEILKCLTSTNRKKSIKIASIGPTTKDYLKKNGITPHVVSTKPDAKHLLESMHLYLKDCK